MIQKKKKTIKDWLLDTVILVFIFIPFVLPIFLLATAIMWVKGKVSAWSRI